MAEVAYCTDHGIPHSEFLSWPEDDQDKVLAYLRLQQEQKADTCRDCGGSRSAMQKNRDTYVVELARCAACELLDDMRDQINKAVENKTFNPRGVKVFIVPADQSTGDGLFGGEE